MSILANLQNINLAFGEKILFKNANLTLSQGDRIGLIGLNGMGKSTLLKIINESLIPDESSPPFIYDKNSELTITYIPQEINYLQNFQGLDVENFYLAFDQKLYQLHLELQDIEQELSQKLSQNDELEIQKLLHKQDERHQKIDALNGWNIAHNYLNYLKRYQFNFDRKIGQLSGGEFKKLSLAAGLSCQSQLVLWDEPTNHLDLQTLEKFEDDIQSQNKAFVMISHDRYMLSNICNKIVHIQNGKINVFQGNYIEYLEFLEEQELQRQKQLGKAQNKHRKELSWMRQGIKARGTRSKKRVESFQAIEKDIQHLKSQAKKVVNLSLEHSGRKSKILAKITNANFAYENNSIFNQINLSLFKQDKVALIGHNGQGKTTLIKILTGAEKLNAGEIFWADQIKINVFSQNRAALDETKSPFELIGDGQDFVYLPGDRSVHVNSYLENFLFQSNQIRRPIKTLSGGEKNRLQLALFMKEACDLWIFDEPTNDLDIETIEILESMLKDYKNAVIIISHDRAFLDNVVNKSWVIHRKKIETFEGGHTKIAPYLQALDLEQELEQELEQQNQDLKHDDNSILQELSLDKNQDENAQRMTNKEKMRWNVIEQEISEAEAKLDHYSSLLADFDFSTSHGNMTHEQNHEKNKEYENLHNQQLKWEKTLEQLYALWEELSQKRP